MMGFSLASFILGVVAWGLILSAFIGTRAWVGRRKTADRIVTFDEFFLLGQHAENIEKRVKEIETTIDKAEIRFACWSPFGKGVVIRNVKSIEEKAEMERLKLDRLMKFLGIESRTDSERTYIRKAKAKGK
jgi:hypothetical protein